MVEQVSLKELYRQAVTFPGSTIPISNLRVALTAMEMGLEHACKQAIERHKHETNSIHQDDHELDVYQLEVTICQILPRVFRGGFLLTLWSVFEAVSIRMAEYACNQCNTSFQLKEFQQNRQTFLESMNKIYTEKLGINAFPNYEEYQKLDSLRQIRNALIHHNGSVKKLPISLRNLSQERYANYGLRIYTDLHEAFFIPDAIFLENNFRLVDEYLKSLSDRVYESVHSIPLAD